MPPAGDPQDIGPSDSDEPELHDLLARHLPKLHGFVQARLGARLRQRESTHDVVQSVCREIVEHGAKFDYRGEERFLAWLYVAARNKIREKHRRHGAQRRDIGRETEAIDPEGMAAFASLLTPSVVAIGNEAATHLRDALAALGTEHREVVTMARIVGMPHAVIAEFTGRSEPAVRQLLARALVRLAEELRRRGVDLSAFGFDRPPHPAD
jgi:RNA polymerase sigma factor (sigma-70 family)